MKAQPSDIFRPIDYKALNPKQKENHNFHQVAAALAIYGYNSMRLNDDWNGADFIALHADGMVLKVQLKGRITFRKNYLGKDLWVACPASPASSVNREWCVYPHDVLFEEVSAIHDFVNSASWLESGVYHWREASNPIKHLFQKWVISS